MWEVIPYKTSNIRIKVKKSELFLYSNYRYRCCQHRGQNYPFICWHWHWIEGSHELISHILSNAEARERWEKCDVLIIDEVSMLSRDLFERLEIIARAIRKCNRPFGGIQLIFFLAIFVN
jgi:thymidine kinase